MISSKEKPFETKPTPELQLAMQAQWPMQVMSSDSENTLMPILDPNLLGARNLPISPYANQIVESSNNPVSLIRSGTGTGKTTVLPLMIMADNELTIVTQPRIIAARETARRMANMITAAGLDGSTLVGYQTSREGNFQDSNRIVVATHGWAQQFLQHNFDEGSKVHVVNDEFHERDPAQDVLLDECLTNGIGTTVMSATIDLTHVKAYLEQRVNYSIGELDLPGRPYERKTIDKGRLVSTAVIDHAHEGRKLGIENDAIAIIVPGRREIDTVRGLVMHRLPAGMRVVEVHGEQSPKEQGQIFEYHEFGTVIIGTSILQTSLTIPNLRVMIDSGWMRIGKFANGVKSIPIIPAPSSVRAQRAGRVSRTGPGIYELAQMNNYPTIPKNKFARLQIPEYEEPQILRIDISTYLLRDAALGRKFFERDLPDNPSAQETTRAIHYLERIGALEVVPDDPAQPNGNFSLQVTEIGQEMAELPIDASLARMLVESKKYGKNVQLQMAAACSIIQAQGICSNKRSLVENWRVLTYENRSDFLAQLDVYLKVAGISQKQREAHSIVERRYQYAKKQFEKLAQVLNLDHSTIKIPDFAERDILLGCILTGTNELGVRHGIGRFRDTDGKTRSLAQSSVVERSERLISATPFNLSRMGQKGPIKKLLYVDATIVTVDMLRRFTPRRLTYGEGRLMLDEHGQIVAERPVYFDGYATRQTISEPAIEKEKVVKYMHDALLKGHSAGASFEIVKGVYAAIHELQDLQDRTDQDLKLGLISKQIKNALKNRSLEDMDSIEKAASHIDIAALRSIVNEEKRADILVNSPDSIIFDLSDGQYEVYVAYKDNIAYITVSARRIQEITHEMLGLGNRQALVRVAGRRFIPLEDARLQYAVSPGLKQVGREDDHFSRQSVVSGEDESFLFSPQEALYDTTKRFTRRRKQGRRSN